MQSTNLSCRHDQRIIQLVFLPHERTPHSRFRLSRGVVNYPSGVQRRGSSAGGSPWLAPVDLRSDSETFLQHATFKLSADDECGVMVPEGLASAFLTMTSETIVIYHMGDFYDSGRYTGIRYNDPLVNIEWPSEPLLISQRDLNFPDLDPARL